MKALRVIGQDVIHSTARHLDLGLNAYTACGLAIVWKNKIRGVSLPLRQRSLAEPVDDPVDCMTCLVNIARGSDVRDPFQGQKLRPGIVLMTGETYQSILEGLIESDDA